MKERETERLERERRKRRERVSASEREKGGMREILERSLEESCERREWSLPREREERSKRSRERV